MSYVQLATADTKMNVIVCTVIKCTLKPPTMEKIGLNAISVRDGFISFVQIYRLIGMTHHSQI